MSHSRGLCGTFSCQKLQVVQYTVTSFQYLPTAGKPHESRCQTSWNDTPILRPVFSGLRALALSGMNWPLGFCVSVLAASPFFGSMVSTDPLTLHINCGSCP